MTEVSTTVNGARAGIVRLVDVSSAAAPVLGLVPTMGALHSGHSALLRAAREHSDIVIASVFVNPLQFDDDADYRHYPRQLQADLDFLSDHGADLVFALSWRSCIRTIPPGR